MSTYNGIKPEWYGKQVITQDGNFKTEEEYKGFIEKNTLFQDLPKEQTIKDTTGQNEEIPINNYSFDEIMKMIDKNQKEQWKREDEIRKHQEEREDSAYQRAVNDMVKAGINPNLMNVTPAESGSGVTTPAEKNYSILNTFIDSALQLKEMDLQEELKKWQIEQEQSQETEENKKDRGQQIVSTLLQIASSFAMMYIGTKLK